MAAGLALGGTAAWAATPALPGSTPPAVAQPAALTPSASVQSAANTEVRVQLKAVRQTVLASEIAGKITELSVKEGDSFKAGQKLVVFDCAVHRARLAHASAAEAAAGKQLEVSNRLDAVQSISVGDIEQARSAVRMAQAESSVGRAMVQRCAISAPFAGRVAERHVDRHAFVAEGKELLSIYDDSDFQLEMIVPSRWMTWAVPGLTFQVHLDETGREYPAEITRVGAAIDPVSQSVKLFGRVTGSTAGLLPGMSGVARMAPPP